MKYFVLHLILFLFFPLTGFSQDYPVKFLSISDGLSNNSVTTIFQDSDGYMWFGTYDGLNRYDGYTFKVFRNSINNPKSLLSNTIYNIEGDSKKNIWIGGSKGICVYDKTNSTFHTVQYQSSNNKKAKLVKDVIHKIRSVSEKLVLVASQNLGLVIFENGLFTGTQIPLEWGNNKNIKFNYDAIIFENDFSCARRLLC